MPTDTSVKFLHSGMTGHPTLTGQSAAGTLIALLDALLVNGFNLVTVDSVVIAGGVGTITRGAGLAFSPGNVAFVAGATVTGGSINGEQKAVATSATTMTFDATGISNQTASGTITVKFAPLGWAKTYSGTNLAAYKPTDVTATGNMLRVDDTGTTSARVVGYETMSDVNTGTGPFPSSAQISGGGFIAKSATADTTERHWTFWGDGRVFYLAVQHTAGSTQHGLSLVFGDPVAEKSPDTYACVLSCAAASVTGSAAGSVTSDYDYGDASTSSNSVFMPRNYSGLGATAIALKKSFPLIVSSSIGARSGLVTGGVPFPNTANGGVYAVPHHLIENSTGVFRGRSPGIYMSPQNVGSGVFANREIVPTISGLSGRVVVAINTSGVLFVDTTGPWR